MRSRSSFSSQQQQTRTIWYQLIDHYGYSYKEVAISEIILPSHASVAYFLRAIKAENLRIFSSIDAAKVKVYKSKDSFQDWEFPLSISELKVLSKYKTILVNIDALIVLIPSKHTIDLGLAHFWNSLATLTLNKHDILKFPIRPEFFPEGVQSLYIRESYKDLYEIICKNLKLSGHRRCHRRCHRMVITGTPGIGKSMFLFYILWRLSKINTTKTVILHRQADEGKIFIFQGNRCWTTCDEEDISELLSDKTAWYLTDDLLDPPEEIVKATTILVSSPDHKHYKEFLRCSNTAPLHYLPVWCITELRIARKMYSRSQKQLENRYLLYGGIPRFVLEKDDDLTEEIDDVVMSLEIDAFGQLVNAAEEEGQGINHLVMHYDVDSTYKKVSLRMSSSYVTEKALDVFLEYQRPSLMRCFRGTR